MNHVSSRALFGFRFFPERIIREIPERSRANMLRIPLSDLGTQSIVVCHRNTTTHTLHMSSPNVFPYKIV